MFLGKSHQWKWFLKQVTPYLQPLIKLVTQEPRSSCCSVALSGASIARSNSVAISRMQLKTAKALVGHLLWLDIVATISTSVEGPLLGFSDSQLLESNIIDMREISGCDNDVAKAICDITELRKWKAHAERHRRLSIIELGARGGSILETLTKRILQLADGQPQSLSPSTFCLNSDSMCSDRLSADQLERDEQQDIRLVFARTAILYLHTVMSGPNPYLGEIQKEIAELMKLFKNLASKGMVRHVPWPLCVTACFADKEQKSFLQDSLTSDIECKSRRRYFKASDEALRVAEECHRIRDEEGRDCDWMLAMDSLNECILLG